MTRQRFALFYVAPTLLLLALAVLPLIAGGRTLYLRDTLNTHLPMKAFQARSMLEGRLPLVDPYRGAGQPHLGNPNTVPLYPDNALYLVADLFWAFNAHFWIHLLLAPIAMFWLGRAWGLRREAAWAAGVCYAGAGFYLANLNLYNLVAGVTWAPALAAAAIRLTSPGAGAAPFAAAAVLWALLLLGGDPLTAAAALLVALTAAAARGTAARREWLRAAAALGLGTLIAAPQLVEFARILPLSYRGHWGFSPEAATVASWHPAAVLDWLLPLPFGAPGLAHWGTVLHEGRQPFYYSLYPGLAALALVWAAGRPRDRAAWWSWSLAAAGLFLALGRFNPLVGLLARLPGAGLLRLPVKLWLLVAVGLALLCGLGFERLAAGPGRRPFGRALAALAALLGALWLVLTLLPGAAAGRLQRWLPAPDAAFAEGERLRWAGLCLLSLALLGLLALLLALGRRRPAAALALLLPLHLAAQLALLRPLLATDQTAVYRREPALLTAVPEGSLAVHGSAGGLFGRVAIDPSAYPDPRPLWLQRQVFAQLYPAAGGLWGRRFDLHPSPEGLGSFLGRAVTQAVAALPDAERVRVLAASGVDRLLLGRPLAPEAANEARLVGRWATPHGSVWVYAPARAAPPVELVGEVRRAPHLNAALALLTDPDFDPRRRAVLPGEGPPLLGPPGVVEIVASGPERLELEADSPAGGALVVQRAFLGIYRATVDGEPARLVAANMHRLGLEVGPGRHRIVIRADRRPLAWSGAASLAGLATLAALGLARRGRSSRAGAAGL